MEIKIINYEAKYRDDMLFCYLSAKDAAGRNAPENFRAPTLRDDLLDIEKYYISKGNPFWLAIDRDDRVVGTMAFTLLNNEELRLSRFFIKPELKRRGIGGRLLDQVENFARQTGVKRIYARFAIWYEGADKFYAAKGFDYRRYDGHLITMSKELQG
ncbi:MAG: GNAT family N-acetyltransferase [Clostridiales bacterium]|jgi:GNAT superfamily N-acetyltransferase|nr:GNAT family N-acetyltransferase [Clostridiales bacterium]